MATLQKLLGQALADRRHCRRPSRRARPQAARPGQDQRRPDAVTDGLSLHIPSGTSQEPGARGRASATVAGSEWAARCTASSWWRRTAAAYQTVATQRGEVTAVSKDSMTVKSEEVTAGPTP